MFEEFQKAIVGLARIQLDLQAQIHAHQMALESLATEIAKLKEPDDPFDVEHFRKQIAELTAQFREKLAIEVEVIDPTIGARLDEGRPPEGSVPDDEPSP